MRAYPATDAELISIAKALLALRRAGKILPVWCLGGKFEIATSEGAVERRSLSLANARRLIRSHVLPEKRTSKRESWRIRRAQYLAAKAIEAISAAA